LAQDVLDKPENAKDAKVAIEQALKDYEKEKQEKQGELTAQLNFQLGHATETWITAMEKEKDGQLGKFIEQDWDKQPRTAIILPPVRLRLLLKRLQIRRERQRCNQDGIDHLAVQRRSGRKRRTIRRKVSPSEYQRHKAVLLHGNQYLLAGVCIQRR
jgi:hypothetical protein